MVKVFINCPFDDEYYPYLKVLLFTVIHCGYSPLIAQTTDSGQARIDKLIQMIKKSSLSIHDISRLQPNESNFPRLNMAFELGLDMGIKNCPPFTDKKIVILETERYRYKKVISDIAGNDIYSYDGDFEILTKQLRNWLWHYNNSISSYNEIWMQYQEFDQIFTDSLIYNNLDPDKLGEIPFNEIIKMMDEFIAS